MIQDRIEVQLCWKVLKTRLTVVLALLHFATSSCFHVLLVFFCSHFNFTNMCCSHMFKKPFFLTDIFRHLKTFRHFNIQHTVCLDFINELFQFSTKTDTPGFVQPKTSPLLQCYELMMIDEAMPRSLWNRYRHLPAPRTDTAEEM